MVYPDYSKVFESYTDTSSNELGTVTTLNSNYSGLLSTEVVETFKVKPTVDAVQCYRTLIVLKQYTDWVNPSLNK